MPCNPKVSALALSLFSPKYWKELSPTVPVNPDLLIVLLFNSNIAGDYTFHTVESVYLSNDPYTKGQQGGGVLKQTSATKGIHIFCTASGNFDAGEFRLYGLRK